MNYVIVKFLRKKTDYRPDLLLHSYGSPILGHPAWEDVPVKIPQETIMYNPDEALRILDQAIKESNWVMPKWVKDHPIGYSLYDKFMTKYIDKFHTTKKQIKHHISDLKNYDFVFTDSFAAISALMARIPYVIRPYGGDIDIFSFEDNFRGRMVRKALQNARAIFAHGYTDNLKKLGLLHKRKPISLVIDTETFHPKKSQSQNFLI